MNEHISANTPHRLPAGSFLLFSHSITTKGHGNLVSVTRIGHSDAKSCQVTRYDALLLCLLCSISSAGIQVQLDLS